MSNPNHHNHPSHTHNFINKQTAVAILILIIFCFWSGYFVGRHSNSNEYQSIGNRSGMVNNTGSLPNYNGQNY